jgi:hypothetical protein
MTIKPTFTGEMQLAGWSESHTSGCKVTFWLSSPEELEAFRALTVRKGNTAGHRFMAALVEIGDDEKPVQEPPKEPIGDACRRAVMWCKDPQFWRWIELNDFVIGQKIASEEQARQFVCQMCEVESRRELDTNPEANKAWHRLIYEPYRIYLENLTKEKP